MGVFVNEFFASCLLMMIGCCVTANVLLKGTKAPGRPWLIVIFGWAIGYSFAYFIVQTQDGVHINPLVTIAYVLLGELHWEMIPVYVFGQFTGAFTGAFIIYFYYLTHFKDTVGARRKLHVFVPLPTNEYPPSLLFNETVGSFTFVFSLLNFFYYYTNPVTIAFLISLVVMTTGIAFGSSVSYANNPVRDLGPRFVYVLLNVKEKGLFRWQSVFIQIFGSLLGGSYAALLFQRILLNVYNPIFWGITIFIVGNLIWLFVNDFNSRKMIGTGKFH